MLFETLDSKCIQTCVSYYHQTNILLHVAHVRTGGGSTFDQTHIHYVAGIPTGGPTKFNAHHPRCLSADVTLAFQRISRTFPLGVAAAL